MYCRATSIIAAAIWATAVSAQTAPPRFIAPPRFPGLAQFTVTTQPPYVLRQFFKSHGPEKPAVCSIPLLQVPPTKNVEQMPVLRPRADNIDNMPSVKLPAPPCEEDKR